MESASNVLSHTLPHQQFSSRIAFANQTNDQISQIRYKSLANKKLTTRLPPISRYDTPVGNRRHEFANNSLSQSVDSVDSCCELNDQINLVSGLDPILRIKQLESNLKFVKQDCQHILHSLHLELDELKTQNRDLQFELIMKGSLSPQLPQSSNKEDMILMPFIKGSLKPDVREHIKRLDNEVKRLRYALGETIKMNALLKSQLQNLDSGVKQTVIKSSDTTNSNNWLPSPTISEFNKTFAEIYQTEDMDSSTTPIQTTVSLPRIGNNSIK